MIYLGPFQPTNQPRGLPAVFSGRDSTASTAIHEVCKRGEQKGFFACRDFCFPLFLFPVPSLDFDLEMSDSFYLMWKKNTEINYLIFLML